MPDIVLWTIVVLGIACAVVCYVLAAMTKKLDSLEERIAELERKTSGVKPS